MKKLLALLLALLMTVGLVSCSNSSEISDLIESADELVDILAGEITDFGEGSGVIESQPPEDDRLIEETGWYYSAEEVASYLNTYGYLPGNFITKDEARDLGWEGGSVERYADGYAIGGDKFGNRESLLPKASGRIYYECDIDTNGRDDRGAKRLVFSNDGLIYYTDDHYESFTLLYGEE